MFFAQNTLPVHFFSSLKSTIYIHLGGTRQSIQEANASSLELLQVQC